MATNKLQVKLLGPLHVQIGENSAEFRTDAQRVLLAYLAMHQGSPQRRDTLAGLLSPDRSNKAALTYLRNRLTRLRDTLSDATPSYFVVDRKQIALRTDDNIMIDVMQFDQQLATVERHAHRQLAGCPTCLAHLREAVALVRGGLLAGLNFPSDTWEAWLVGQREYYQQRALDALTLLREASAVHGAWEEVLAIAQRQLTLEAWLESAHRAMMQAHYQLGDRNAALAQYAQCQEILWDELGIEPEAETTRLFERMQDQSGGIGSSPALYHATLPVQTGAFFGRKAELSHLLNLLVNPTKRLVTLVGTGGVGKTRLAIEAGQQVAMNFPDGVYFVPLDTHDGAEQIKIAVGEAAGLGETGKQLTGEQVIAILRDKQMLLLFDNCETVLDELAFIPTWLMRAPQIAILATSREPLNFAAESVVLLDGLSLDEAEALFAERGQMARDGFVVTEQHRPQVHQICQLVDRSPLGVALAAAWVRRRSLRQIVDSIGRSLDFLSTRLHDIDPRHRSMRAVFETSWQLLTAEEQAILAALSVFPTTFSADAASKIAGATLFDLDVLCEKSLLQQQQESERYGMHSLVRQFSADKLAARTPAIDRSFADYFFEFAETHQQAFPRLQPEWRNFSAGIAKAHQLEAWQLVIDFVRVLDEAWFRQIRYSDMRAGLALAVDAATALQDREALANVLLRLGEIEMEQNAYLSAETHLTVAQNQLLRLEESAGIAQATYLLGRIKADQAQDEAALALFFAAQRIFEDEDDVAGIAQCLNMIALCYMKQQPDFQTARTYFEQSIALQRTAPLTSTYVEALRYLARIDSNDGDHAAAESCLIEAASVSQQRNDMGDLAAVLFERMILCKHRQEWAQAVRFGQDCLAHFQKLGSLRWEGQIKTQLGILHQAMQQPEPALAFFLAAHEIFVALDDPFEQAHCYYYLHKLYAESGASEESRHALQSARQINAKLNSAWLRKLMD